MVDFVFRDAIVRRQSFQGGSYQDVAVTFSSFLEVNLAYAQMERGYFLGDGWEECNLFGLQLLDGRMEREEFLKCSMGNTRFKRVELYGVWFSSVVFMRSVWEKMTVKRGKFKNCNFRGMRFLETIIEKTIFRDCVFDNTDMEEIKMSEVVFVNCVFLRGQKVPASGCKIKNGRFS